MAGRPQAGRVRYHCLTEMLASRYAAVALGIALTAASFGRPAPASKLSIAAAADLQFALADAARQFQQQHPNTQLAIDYGSSGNFYAQIRNGAPFDMYLSADVQYPRNLAHDGVIGADAVFVYAAGKIAVWVPASSKLDPATALRDPSVRHLAIANPQHAPYGRAAEAALHSMGIYDSVAPKLVLGENISQTLQFVQSGAADAGIVALSLAVAPNVRAQGRYWEIPANQYPKIEQGGAILKDSPAAREFRDWLLGASGRALLQQYGFSLPGE
jgi:molybdate transport system substrate-binding protein